MAERSSYIWHTPRFRPARERWLVGPMNPLLTGTVYLRHAHGSLPLEKGGQEGFSNDSIEQILPDPPFSKEGTHNRGLRPNLSTISIKEAARGRLLTRRFKTSPDPSLVRRGTCPRAAATRFRQVT